MPLDMPISSLASIRLSKKRNLLVLLTFLMLLFWIMGSCGKAYGSALKLEDFPVPFVSGGFLNCTFVLASSDGHGPCGGAHTMDVMGAIMVSSSLGLKGDGGLVNAAMDDWISTYDFQAVKVTVKDLSSNLVVVGGPGVNQVTWHYNGLTDSNGNRILPVYFDKEENETDVIRVATSGTTYKIEYENGKVKADYGIVLIFQESGRYVLILAGLGGGGTWASCKVVSEFEKYGIAGEAIIVKYYDSNSDGFLDAVSIVENNIYTAKQTLSINSFPLIGLSLTPLMPKLKSLRKSFLRRLKVPVAASLIFLMIFLTVMANVSSAPVFEIYTLNDFPVPFVSGGFMNCTFVLASSDGHGPCGGAHTMDVMGAIMVSSSLGLKGDGGMVNAAMDDWISTYDFQAVKVTVKDLSSNLVVVGGPGVNQVTWHYNGLTDSNGNRILPVYFDKEENETDVIRVATS
ncbi:MAG: hypothetical protein QW222_01520, partial [Candidatus Bathyarchaeia archaeon]